MKKFLTILLIAACVPAFATKIQLLQDDIVGGIETTAGQVVVGNASGNPAAVTLTGDVTVTSAGVLSITASAVTTTEILAGTILTGDIADGTILAADIGNVELAAIGGLVSAANGIPYFTGSGTAGQISSSANVITYLAAADNAAMAAIIAPAIIEGGLADSIVLTGDIKDGEIVAADLDAAAAVASTQLAFPCIRTLSQVIAVAEFSDVTTDAVGTLDLSTQIPAESIVIGWKFVGTGAFAGDTTATMQVGDSSNADAFSSVTNGSVFTAVTIGAECKTGVAFALTATTVRVTVTGGADFTSIVSDGNGAGTITLYYMITQ